MTAPLTAASESDLAEILAARHASRQPLSLRGGGTRGLVEDVPGTPLSTAALSGVVLYEPGEMTLIARAGTPLREITALLDDAGQNLAFEPPDLRATLGLGGEPTLGGMVATNASGPRRVLVGACRDHVLGVRFVDGRGRIVKNGGRVMKNVTGLDLSRLLAGSCGTLGVLTEIALKTLPHLPDRLTLAFAGLDADRAQALFSLALATPREISGAAFHAGTAWLRIEGLGPQAALRRDKLLRLLGDWQPQEIGPEDSATLWRDLRDVAPLRDLSLPLWRLLVRARDGAATIRALREQGGEVLADWGGALIWYQGQAPADTIRHIAPYATLIRPAGLSAPRFAPQEPGLERLAEGLRRTFDPAGILNPGLMETR